MRSLYFTNTIESMQPGSEYKLDFTYLFDESLDNFDYPRMGQGEVVRSAADDEPRDRDAIKKRRKAAGREIIGEIDARMAAISGHDL